MNNLLIIGLVVVALTTILSILSTAIPFWAASGDFHNGLWQSCYSSTCVDYPEAPGELEATRAMMILSILTLAASSVCAALFAFVMKTQPLLGTVGGILACVGGGFSLLGAIIFAAKKDDLVGSMDLHASFALAIISFVFGEIAGGLLIKSRSGAVGLN